MPYLRIPYILAQWAVSAALYSIAIAAGVIGVAAGLAGDGAARTPRMWRFWGSVSDVPVWWHAKEPVTWRFALPVAFALLAWLSYGSSHPLVTIYFVFATLATLSVLRDEDVWQSFHWLAIRNPVLGLDKYLPPAPEVKQYGSIDEMEPGFQWRYRHTTWRDSLRLAWGEPRPSKGKREIYVGYKIGPDVDNTSFTMQFRVF